MSGGTGPREQAHAEEEPQPIRLPVLLQLQQDEERELDQRWHDVVSVERRTSGASLVRRVYRIGRAGRMTRAQRPKPLRQIHSDPTRAHGLHMHHFYYFDTATDLYVRER